MQVGVAVVFAEHVKKVLDDDGYAVTVEPVSQGARLLVERWEGGARLSLGRSSSDVEVSAWPNPPTELARWVVYEIRAKLGSMVKRGPRFDA